MGNCLGIRNRFRRTRDVLKLVEEVGAAAAGEGVMGFSAECFCAALLACASAVVVLACSAIGAEMDAGSGVGRDLCTLVDADVVRSTSEEIAGGAGMMGAKERVGEVIGEGFSRVAQLG